MDPEMQADDHESMLIKITNSVHFNLSILGCRRDLQQHQQEQCQQQLHHQQHDQQQQLESTEMCNRAIHIRNRDYQNHKLSLGYLFVYCLAGLFTLLLIVEQAHAIKCYICSSVEDPGCGLTLDMSNHTAIDCTDDAYVKAANGQAKVCRKLVQHAESRQLLSYASLAIILCFTCIISGQPPSIPYIFNHKLLRLSSGTLVVVSHVINSLVGAYLLKVFVERSKACLDFTITNYTIHLLLTWWYTRSIPDTFQWWFINIVCISLMCITGEYLCRKEELKSIPLSCV
ncbi:Protein SYS1-like protein [Fragariocoptes setiger]|uniref:Protein SYS1-like protein n=1 Tax=Fragariocoptes setiger TaxID=1670756 RepID=A0ABQ7SC21_9ACAR|nr:Protein SYS1-like protein [Fragariocoptes setiger]